ncbi:MAG: glycerol kinase GlpK [Oscillospiraceae bacterium]|nr:glycerol kinase GlpK [Oscillospiraceae bacterium]
MSQWILSLDQGTTSSRAVLFDENGNNLFSAQYEFPQYFPQAGWVEHDPAEILDTQLRAMRDALQWADTHGGQVIAVGVTNQRETTILWEKPTGKPVCPAIVWQCRRTAEFCRQLAPQKEMIRQKTGLIADPYFSATKLHWMLEHISGAKERAERGELLFGTVDSWLIWNLTGGRVHATDVTNASRTMLFNIHTRTWDRELLELLGIPECILPEVRPSSGEFGVTEASLCGASLPILGCAGDQQAALFGQRCFGRGDVKNTYGTGGFLLMNTGETPVQSRHGLLTTIAWSIGGNVTYALEGSVFISSAVIKWLRDELGLIRTAGETEQIAAGLADNGGVYLVPAFVGLGTPYWDSEARGTLTGLTRGTGKAHIVRAALEAVAYQTADVLHAMEADTAALGEIRADGGAAQNGFLMQFQADILGRRIVRPKNVESTAKGAALLAGLSAGLWDFGGLTALQEEHTAFAPSMSQEERERLCAGWKEAVRRTRSDF